MGREKFMALYSLEIEGISVLLCYFTLHSLVKWNNKMNLPHIVKNTIFWLCDYKHIAFLFLIKFNFRISKFTYKKNQTAFSFFWISMKKMLLTFERRSDFVYTQVLVFNELLAARMQCWLMLILLSIATPDPSLLSCSPASNLPVCTRVSTLPKVQNPTFFFLEFNAITEYSVLQSLLLFWRVNSISQFKFISKLTENCCNCCI